MNVGFVATLVAIASSLIGGCIALVNLGIKVGKVQAKIGELDNDNFKFGKNNQERFNEMQKLDNQQNQEIALLKQSLDAMQVDIREIKDNLSSITSYIRNAESERAKIESRLEYIERDKYRS